MSYDSDCDDLYKCRLCVTKGAPAMMVKKSQLRDHIGGVHFGQFPHRCQTCGFKFSSGKKAYKHAGRTGHVVTLNEVGSLRVGWAEWCAFISAIWV